jgi:hypothetical protein
MTALEIPAISPALTAALSADRLLYNSQLTMLRSRQPNLDFKAVKEFLRVAIDPIVRAVQVVDPDRCRFVTQACFEQMLVLSEHALLGKDARSLLIQATWQQVVPKLASNLTRDAAAVLALVTNAIDRIATTPNTRPESWISGMTTIAPMLDGVEQIRAVGQILAWRAGLAQYRYGALKAARELPDRVGSAVFSSSVGSWQESVEQYLRQPWWHGENSLSPATSQGMRVGAFAGWDGAFMTPPKLRAAAEGFWVASGARCFHLLADAFGAVLIPSNEMHFTAASIDGVAPNGVEIRDERVRTLQGDWPVPVPKHDLVLTCNADTVCISSPWSHHIWLYPQ